MKLVSVEEVPIIVYWKKGDKVCDRRIRPCRNEASVPKALKALRKRGYHAKRQTAVRIT